MNPITHAAEFRGGQKLDSGSIVAILMCTAVLSWAVIQLYIEFSLGSETWFRALPEAQYTNLNYLVFWLRIIPGLLVLLAGFQLLSGRVLMAASYASIFLAHLVAVLVTDRAQIVKGLVYAFGL
jgi:hypothetical protein